MIRGSLKFVLVLALALGATGFDVTAAGAEGVTLADRMIRRVNQVRKEHGLAPMKLEVPLAKAAAGHARDMAENDFLGHRGSDGLRLELRVKRTGFKFKHVAENVAGGLASPEKTVDNWMKVADHRRNLLDPNFCRIGAGHAFVPGDDGKVRHGHYWVLIMARPPSPFCPVR